jgi:hypothetical protein
VRDTDVIGAIEEAMGTKRKGKRKLVEASQLDSDAEDRGEGSSKKARGG